MSSMTSPVPSRRSVIGGALGVAGLAACGGPTKTAQEKNPAATTPGASRTATSTPSPSSMSSTTSAPPAPLELPGGGRTIFPANRLFGWCGAPNAPALGQLGIGNLDTEMDKMIKVAPQWGDGRSVLPVAELIATVVQGSPGRDGMYRVRMDDSVIDTWLKAARKRKALLLLNIQPGRARFIDEAKSYEKWLVEPDVGLALDPEWAIGPGQIPGRVFGHTTGAVVDSVASYLSGLVEKHRLPEKALVVHVLRPDILRAPAGLTAHDGVALVKSVDGIGGAAAKTGTYERVMKGTPEFFRPGFKLFFSEDAKAGPLMTPKQVLALRPQPDYVLYE